VKVSLAILATVLSLGFATPSTTPPVPVFTHIIVFVFENHEYASVIGNAQAPTFTRTARAFGTLTHYDAVTHPSLPNYIALVSGSTNGIVDDCTRCTVDAPNLADELETAHKAWRVYAEGLPRTGYTGAFAGRYAKKHDPFVYFRDIADNQSRLRNIVPLSRLRPDLRSNRFPDFAFVVPDLCHSMHDCSVRAGDAWLRRELPPLLRLPATAVFVIFDEGVTGVGGGGHVPALVAGTAVSPHSRYTAVTSHYGLLRTIEDAWGLEHLGRSAAARPITGIWR
jgi:phosphatidylinositol-3-phosphatase